MKRVISSVAALLLILLLPMQAEVLGTDTTHSMPQTAD